MKLKNGYILALPPQIITNYGFINFAFEGNINRFVIFESIYYTFWRYFAVNHYLPNL